MSTPTPRRLDHVGTYRRTVRASVERIWENALDWEHLPWLHRSSFREITLLDRDPTFWRARVVLALGRLSVPAVLELRTDRPRLAYVTRTVEGSGAGTEIRTQLEPAGERTTRIRVEFHQAGTARLLGRLLGAGYAHLYARLWSEDEEMMVRRQAVLDDAAARRSVDPPRDSAGPLPEIALGRDADVRARLPLLVDTPRGQVRLVAVNGDLVAHATRCPHLGGPLETADVLDGAVTCPWHGYRFDVRTGGPVGQHRCRLAPAPRVTVDADGVVRLTWDGPLPGGGSGPSPRFA